MQQAEGIVLKVMPIENDKMLTVFTPDHGVIKLIYKRFQKEKNINPLMRAQFVYHAGKNDLHKAVETSPINHYLELRKTLPLLETACEMLRVVLISQMVHKPAPALYKLLIFFLDGLSKVNDPERLLYSFYLKTLRHEGLWELQTNCSRCGTELKSLHLYEGHSYCLKHLPIGGFSFTEEDAAVIASLAYGRNLSQLAEQALSTEGKALIKQLFQTLLSA